MAERPVERMYTTAWADMRTAVEVRSGPDGRMARRIGGYAAVFNKRSQPLGGFREVVERSFFNKSQSDGWPGAVCRFEHNPLMLLGTTASGTLQLCPDDIGLDYLVDLPECRSDVYELADRRDIRSSSFSFQVFQDDWKPTGGGYPVRHLVTGRLIDVAPTAIPAYPDATVGLRSLANFKEVPFEDVQKYAAKDDLRRFFIRTDQRSTPEDSELKHVDSEDKPVDEPTKTDVQPPVEQAKDVEPEGKPVEQAKDVVSVEKTEDKMTQVTIQAGAGGGGGATITPVSVPEPVVERLPAPADLFAETDTTNGKSVREAKLELMALDWESESV